jgi:predicted Zn-dependent protease
LQRRDYELAGARLREVVDRYPNERELTDRARVYPRVCEREMRPKPKAPCTLDERLYAATIALNAGEVSRALALLTDAREEAPNDVRVRYMLSAVQARRGARAEALAELRRATELDAESRVLARRDADFENLHTDEEFLELTAPPAGGRRRRPRARVPR